MVLLGDATVTVLIAALATASSLRARDKQGLAEQLSVSERTRQRLAWPLLCRRCLVSNLI